MILELVAVGKINFCSAYTLSVVSEDHKVFSGGLHPRRTNSYSRLGAQITLP